MKPFIVRQKVNVDLSFSGLSPVERDGIVEEIFYCDILKLNIVSVSVYRCSNCMVRVNYWFYEDGLYWDSTIGNGKITHV